MNAPLLTFRPRAEPLAPVALWAEGEASTALLRRLLRLPSLDGLRGVVGERLVVLLGAAERLPWVDGCGYLGTEPLAPGLLLPTALQPSLPTAVVARAALLDLPPGAAPVALFGEPLRRVALGMARPLDRASLQAALAAAPAAGAPT